MTRERAVRAMRPLKPTFMPLNHRSGSKAKWLGPALQLHRRCCQTRGLIESTRLPPSVSNLQGASFERNASGSIGDVARCGDSPRSQGFHRVPQIHKVAGSSPGSGSIEDVARCGDLSNHKAFPSTRRGFGPASGLHRRCVMGLKAHRHHPHRLRLVEQPGACGGHGVSVLVLSAGQAWRRALAPGAWSSGAAALRPKRSGAEVLGYSEGGRKVEENEAGRNLPDRRGSGGSPPEGLVDTRARGCDPWRRGRDTPPAQCLNFGGIWTILRKLLQVF